VWSRLIEQRWKVIKVGYISFKFRLSLIFTDEKKKTSHSQQEIIDCDQVIHIVGFNLLISLYKLC
jgi:hypothetical protein